MGGRIPHPRGCGIRPPPITKSHEAKDFRATQRIYSPIDSMIPLAANNPLQPVLDVYNSGVFRAGIRLLLLLIVLLWLALALWVYKDARRRMQDPILIGVAVAAGLLFPFVGPFIYLFLRPPEYLADVRERELEIRLMERRFGGADHCPYCQAPVEEDYLVCPVCSGHLKKACTSCQRPLDPTWRVCPYCAAPPPPRA